MELLSFAPLRASGAVVSLGGTIRLRVLVGACFARLGEGEILEPDPGDPIDLAPRLLEAPRPFDPSTSAMTLSTSDRPFRISLKGHTQDVARDRPVEMPAATWAYAMLASAEIGHWVPAPKRRPHAVVLGLSAATPVPLAVVGVDVTDAQGRMRVVWCGDLELPAGRAMDRVAIVAAFDEPPSFDELRRSVASLVGVQYRAFAFEAETSEPPAVSSRLSLGQALTLGAAASVAPSSGRPPAPAPAEPPSPVAHEGGRATSRFVLRPDPRPVERGPRRFEVLYASEELAREVAEDRRLGVEASGADAPRALFLRLLARPDHLDAEGVAALLAEGGSARGGDLVVVRARIAVELDEVARLSTLVTTLRPLARHAPAIAEALAEVDALTEKGGLEAAPHVAVAETQRLLDVLARSTKPEVQASVRRDVDVALARRRAYQTRTVDGVEHVRLRLVSEDPAAGPLCYLPDEGAKRLPLVLAFEGSILASVRAPLEEGQAEGVLSVRALARDRIERSNETR